MGTGGDTCKENHESASGLHEEAKNQLDRRTCRTSRPLEEFVETCFAFPPALCVVAQVCRKLQIQQSWLVLHGVFDDSAPSDRQGDQRPAHCLPRSRSCRCRTRLAASARSSHNKDIDKVSAAWSRTVAHRAGQTAMVPMSPPTKHHQVAHLRGR